MNEQELDAILKTWEAPSPSPALRENVRLSVPPGPRKHGYRWMTAAASVVATTALLGVAMLGKTEAQLADGTRIQTSIRVEPASAQERFRKTGFGTSTGGTLQQGYWYDSAAHTYSGYDLTVKSLGGDRYLMTASGLSTPLPKLSPDIDAAQYRAVPLPAIPAPRVVKEGEPFDIDLVRDPKTGDHVFLRVEVSRPSFHGFLEGMGETMYERHIRFIHWVHSFFGAGEQLHLESAKLYVNGVLAFGDAAGDSAGGDGVYFYLPGQGRYAMTLDKAGDTRFHRAGTVDGSTMEFQLDGNSYRIVSQSRIAPAGKRPIYVFHEKDFRLNPGFDKPHFGGGRPGHS